MLIAPIFFSACEGSEEITGKFEFTIDGTSYSFPLATFIKRDGKTIVTSTDVSNTGTVVFSGTSTGTYTLEIVTQFSSGTSLLKEPRTASFDKILTVQ